MTSTLVEKEILSEEWGEVLAPFLDSAEFEAITSTIKNCKSKGEVIYPATDCVFRAFNMCYPQDVKVVLCLQDPYHQPGVADGIPMSCSLTDKYQPSLMHFNRGIKEDTGRKNDIPCDLGYLSVQGVLILNRSLTVKKGQPRSMIGVWDKFHDYLFAEILNKITHPIVYILMGSYASWFARYARMQDLILTPHHPASAAYNEGKWDHKNVFTRCNKFLVNNNLKPINW